MVSVITVTFNNFDELKRTINSLEKAQGIELIIVNGGSCPQSREFLNHLSLPFPFSLIQEPDEGISDAFNKGAKKARGSAITYLNSGDLLQEANYYQMAENYLQENQQIFFVHSDILYDDPLCGVMPISPRNCNPGRGMPYHHQSMIVRKNVFEEIGLFKKEFKIVMDYDFTLRMLKKGYQGHYLEFEKPPIFMDGRGVSANQEGSSIRESFWALKENNFITFYHLFPYGIRVFFYFLRRLSFFFGLRSWMKKLKIIKNKKN